MPDLKLIQLKKKKKPETIFMLFFLLVYQLHKNAGLYEFFLIYFLIYIVSVFMSRLIKTFAFKPAIKLPPISSQHQCKGDYSSTAKCYKLCRSQLAYQRIRCFRVHVFRNITRFKYFCQRNSPVVDISLIFVVIYFLIYN